MATGGTRRRWVFSVAALCAVLALVGIGLALHAKIVREREPVLIWTRGNATAPRISDADRQRLIDLVARTVSGSNGQPLCIAEGDTIKRVREQELAVEVRLPESRTFATPRLKRDAVGRFMIVVLRGEMVSDDGRAFVLVWGDPRSGGALISPLGVAELRAAAEAAVAK